MKKRHSRNIIVEGLTIPMRVYQKKGDNREKSTKGTHTKEIATRASLVTLTALRMAVLRSNHRRHDASFLCLTVKLGAIVC